MPDRTEHARSGAAAPAAPHGSGPHGPDPDRLRALEARLAEARARRAPPPAHGEEHYSQASIAWRMVTEMVAGIGIGLGIGLGLDALMGTRPLMLVAFVLLGFAAGVRVMMRTAEEVGRDMERGAKGTAMEGARDGA